MLNPETGYNIFHHITPSYTTPDTMVMLNNVTFSSRSVSVYNVYRDCKDGIYNLDPIHQRNVIHPEAWKADIIDSLICVGDIPGVYFHPVGEHGATSDSLDGKQRLSAIVEFFDGTVKYNGKYFKDHSEATQIKFKQTPVNIITASRQLKPEEIEKFFLSRQNSLTTKIGEKLNSQITTIARKFLTTILKEGKASSSDLYNNLNKIKPTNIRFEHLEILTRLLYTWLHHKSKKIDIDGEKKIIKWFVDVDRSILEKKDKFKGDVEKLLELLVNLNINYSGSKNIYIPFFAAILTEAGNAVKIATYYQNGNKFNFGDVGGNHNIAKKRYEEIINIIAPSPVIQQ